jgi:NAD(P) transhydrogenase subunit beta
MALVIATVLTGILGIHFIMAIGGADMPVVVSMLNSYSGWAAAAAGFMLGNDLLIITGALVGSSGAILSYIMCKGMNRSFVSVMLGGFGTEGGTVSTASGEPQGEVHSVDAAGASDLLLNSKKIIIVPGYGLAVAQAQHSLAEVVKILKEQNVEVKFAIHPVAGRLPGHMNVLLAEANIPYDIVFEMDEVNDEFTSTDVAWVIGANDIVNPSAMDDPGSPIAGMPVLHVWEARTCIVMKRGMASGYAGVDNPLFYKDNTLMLFGDAKKVVDEILSAMRQ